MKIYFHLERRFKLLFEKSEILSVHSCSNTFNLFYFISVRRTWHRFSISEVDVLHFIYSSFFFVILTFHLVLVLKTHVHCTPFQCRLFFSLLATCVEKQFFWFCFISCVVRKEMSRDERVKLPFWDCVLRNLSFSCFLCFDVTGKEMCPKNR